MIDIKKYTDIIRYGKSCTEGVLKEGDIISITEKIDCANASFRTDETNEEGVSCYSRNKPLGEHNTLSGFYNWVKNNIVPIKNKLNKNYIYFGEWLVKHKVVYKEECYNKFYMFSIWDVEKEEYLSDEMVINEAKRLGLTTTNYFYRGEYISYDHLMSFVGKSNMTLKANTGEGIVVKNVDYKDKFGKQVFVKLVSEAFCEVQKQKKPKNPNIDNGLLPIVMTVLTKARIEKMLYKLVDEGELKQDYDIKDMRIILKLLGTNVYNDIMKEESELFVNFEESQIKRCIGKNIPSIVKEILKEQNRM